VALRGHGLGVAFVWNNRVYVYASDWGQTEKKWGIKKVHMTWSDDLKTWSEPTIVLRANENERLFNVAVVRGKDQFIMLAETDDPTWPKFTFKYFTSKDLSHWSQVPGAFYGQNKYVGGPAIYFEGGNYYTLYLQSLGKGRYETCITRSNAMAQD